MRQFGAKQLDRGISNGYKQVVGLASLVRFERCEKAHSCDMGGHYEDPHEEI